MIWQETYPTLAAVNEAAFSTLEQWDKRLPDPQTDVERTIRKRIKRSMAPTMGDELKRQAPEVHAKFTDLLNKMADVCNKAKR